jgi:ABC-type polysaccharide/polyol phosphate export permease
MSLLVFTFIFQSVLPLNIAHYSAYVFSGLLAWSWFSSCINQAAYLIVFSRDLVRRPQFNTEILVIVNIASNLVSFLLAMPILLGLLLFDNLYPTWAFLFLPLILLVQFIFTLGLSLILSSLNVYYRDVGHLSAVIITVWFYITPVFYQARGAQKNFEWVFNINPMTHILEAYRKIFVEQQAPDAVSLGGVTIASVLICGLGWLVFSRLKNNFVDEI